MKVSKRILALALIVSCFAVAAGITAERALANGSTVYCGDCTLSSSGTPAVSAVYKDFYYNDEAVAGADDLHIYNYYSGTTTCSYRGYSRTRIWTGYPNVIYPNSASCIPSTTFADARCQLADGTGPDTAYCYAEYETVG